MAFTHIQVGDKTSHSSLEFRIKITSSDRTVSGLNRVIVSVNDSEPGTFLVNDEGQVQDAILPTSTKHTMSLDDLKRLTRTMDPFSKHLGLRTLTINRPVTLELPTAELGIDPPEDLAGLLPSHVAVSYEFTGYVTIGASRLAAIRIVMPNMLSEPISPGADRLERATSDGTAYLHPADGLLHTAYIVMTLGGHASGKPLHAQTVLHVVVIR